MFSERRLMSAGNKIDESWASPVVWNKELFSGARKGNSLANCQTLVALFPSLDTGRSDEQVHRPVIRPSWILIFTIPGFCTLFVPPITIIQFTSYLRFFGWITSLCLGKNKIMSYGKFNYTTILYLFIPLINFCTPIVYVLYSILKSD